MYTTLKYLRIFVLFIDVQIKSLFILGTLI